MTSKKPVSFLMGLCALVSALAFAGNDSGNGGHSVICAKGGAPISIEFFDLWYAKKEIQMGLIDSKLDAKALGKAIVLRLFEIDKAYFEPLLVSYAGVSRAQVRIGSDLELVPPKAYLGNLVPAVESGCRIAPLAVYSDSGVLLTDGKIWDFLTGEQNPVPANVHVAAFYVHEALGDMLRKRELTKLAPGERMPEETRKRIARDTVSLTALAFAKLSDRGLVRRMKRYWATGELFEKPKIDRLEIKHTLWTDGVYEDHKPAQEAAAHLCEPWLAREKARLAPLTEFLIAKCGYAGSTTLYQANLVKAGTRGYVTATLTLVPNRPVVKFSEGVYSELFSPSGDYQNLANMPSWIEKAKTWRADVEKRFGARLFFATEGEYVHRQKISRVWRWRQHFAGKWRMGYTGIDYVTNDAFTGFAKRWDDERELGEMARSSGAIYLFVDAPELRTETETIEGTRYGFHVPENESTEREAARVALGTYREACMTWKEAKYKAGAFYASCTSDLPTYRVDAAKSTSWFATTGTAYYAED